VNTRDWALAYADLGWRVFPVIAGGKRPLYRGWQRDATTDPQRIERWWHGGPGEPNIGIVTGEAFVAYDFEAAHLPALQAWIKRRGLSLPDTPIARTGRAGIHILARAHARASSGRELFLEGVHIGELKSAGGFIVACPSRTSGVLMAQVTRGDRRCRGSRVATRPGITRPSGQANRNRCHARLPPRTGSARCPRANGEGRGGGPP
jgi:hypothetical protein